MSDRVENPDDESSDTIQTQPMENESDSINGMIAINSGNRLIDGALPLLTLINTIKRLDSPISISVFYDSIQRQLQRYEIEIQHPDIKQATLILSATLDELIMGTSWGGSYWIGETLCSRLFNRRDAGIYAFEIIDRYLMDSENHMDLLFLSFICFKSGFSGQFIEGKREGINLLQVNLYHLFIKQGILQKQKLEPKSDKEEFKPLKSFPYRRSLLFFLGAFILQFFIGGALIYQKKDIAIVTLEDARSVTNQTTDGYQSNSMESIHELLFNKNH